MNLGRRPDEVPIVWAYQNDNEISSSQYKPFVIAIGYNILMVHGHPTNCHPSEYLIILSWFERITPFQRKDRHPFCFYRPVTRDGLNDDDSVWAWLDDGPKTTYIFAAIASVKRLSSAFNEKVCLSYNVEHWFHPSHSILSSVLVNLTPSIWIVFLNKFLRNWRFYLDWLPINKRESWLNYAPSWSQLSAVQESASHDQLRRCLCILDWHLLPFINGKIQAANSNNYSNTSIINLIKLFSKNVRWNCKQISTSC